MLKVKDITKSFKQDFWSKSFNALDKVSFDINEGEIVGFLGANGAGKTTLLKIIMGFIPCDKGEIVFDPKLGKSKKEIFKKIGFLPERPYFYPYLKGREFIEYVAIISELDKRIIRERTELLSREFKIDHALDRDIRGYSKGMLQRLGFVATLIHDPDLIILDEPLSGLDPVGRKEIKDHLVALNKKGKTVFFSSHIVSDIEEICTKTVVLNKGQLTYEGSIERLISENTDEKFYIFIDSKSINDFVETLDYETLGEKIRLTVGPDEKDNLVNNLVKNSISIDEIRKSHVTLEEVIYEI
ncbi:ABC transporter ATP-binding protein [Halobacteriovorax sp. HLS]|uniref:ABC transporter ATP-binding protein n=1 Tax=Halobacteriovorax sp. HLS TaxID=2234000 RepID=UPI000FD9C071|nr:ABC transporter ATP-binding protein [Halobacteriovorax sp. HLS]